MAPLERLARHVWATGLFRAIQTAGEMEETPTAAQLQDGEQPMVRPFAILDETCWTDERTKTTDFLIEKLPNGGHLIRQTVDLH